MAILDPASLATMSPEELARSLRVDTASIDALSRTIAHDPRSTIAPSMAPPDAPGRRAIASLDAERVHRRIAGGLSIERTLGEGGMGVVRMATQRSLGRKVAVKTLRPDTRTERTTLHLLREAWVTGSLEHPNIVPVYDLGLDDDGSPIIVLKKIEGVAWERLLADPAELARRFGATDPLEHNLRTLVQVCNAVSLAHARGILHRDLKPENVMIGSFGEVYLVDWGLAVSVREDPTGRLPYAKDLAKDVAGTPCYMAPEMLGGGGELSERTDVYLLGAILYEILTGNPPHRGSFTEIVTAILASNPRFGPDVPPELAAIAIRAMSRDPAERFASVDELRQRVEWYLQRRGSLALSTEGHRRLERARERLSAGAAARDEIYPLLAEARFAFRQALATSEDNEGAREGLADAIETAVRFELDHGTPEAAAAALAELDTKRPELAERVRDAVAGASAKRAELERLQRQHDRTIGQRTRAFVLLVMTVVWVGYPLAGTSMEARSSDPHLTMMSCIGVLLALALGLGFWARASLGKTLVNRNLYAIVMLTLAADLLLQIGARAMGMWFPQSIPVHFMLWFLASGVVAVLFERLAWISAVAYAAAFFVVCFRLDLRWWVMSASHLSLIFVVVRARWHEVSPRAIDGASRARSSPPPPR